MKLIGIIGRVGGTVGAATARELTDTITEVIEHVYSLGHCPFVEVDTVKHFAAADWMLAREDCPVLRVGTFQSLGMTGVEYAIVIGGDGTMLHAAKALAGWRIPLIGINQGHLGFITDIPQKGATAFLADILDGKHVFDHRTMLEGYKLGETELKLALNDISISRAGGRIIEFRVFVNLVFAYQARGDGVLVSTPTGSTAYAMSAGGPIIAPQANVIEVVTLLAQTLSHRPLILHDTSVVKVEMMKGDAIVYADGNEVSNLLEGESYIVQLSPLKGATFVHPKLDAFNHFRTLRGKLNWQHQPGTRNVE